MGLGPKNFLHQKWPDNDFPVVFRFSPPSTPPPNTGGCPAGAAIAAMSTVPVAQGLARVGTAALHGHATCGRQHSRWGEAESGSLGLFTLCGAALWDPESAVVCLAKSQGLSAGCGEGGRHAIPWSARPCGRHGRQGVKSRRAGASLPLGARASPAAGMGNRCARTTLSRGVSRQEEHTANAQRRDPQ